MMMHRAVIALRPGLGRLHPEQAQGGDLAEKKVLFLVRLLGWFPKVGYCSAA